MCICHSPQLFAAYHVFLRLLVPRHSPCALFAFFLSIIFRFIRLVISYNSFQYSVFKVHQASDLLVRELEFINASHLFITGVRRTPSCLSIHALARINALDRLCTSTVPSSQCLRGDGEIRTHDPLLARQVLSQLSYTPI